MDSRRVPAWLGTSAALLLFLCALAIPYWDFLSLDWSVAVPIQIDAADEPTGKIERWRTGFWKRAQEADSGLHVFGIAGNAERLLDPARNLFDAPHCHPLEKSLALGEPLITLGVLAAPISLLTRDPILTYNGVLLLSAWLAAVAMWMLIREWTGSWAAGVVAGILYGFHALKLHSVVYPFVNDTTWFVFAMLFARRYFEVGGWRNAVLFALSAALQLGTSFYPLLASVLMGIPFAIWLFPRRRDEGFEPVPAMVAIAFVCVVAGFVFLPYLEMRDSLGLVSRVGAQAFGAWGDFAPGGRRFPGWICVLLASVGVLFGKQSGGGTSLRWALVTGGGAVLLCGMGWGGIESPSPLYRALGVVVPGLDSIRRPNEILTGIHLLLSVFAGFGAAALLSRLADRFEFIVAAVLVALIFVVTLRPASLGLDPVARYRGFEIRPDAEKLAFFEALEQAGNTGPIFEAPIKEQAAGSFLASRRMVTALFHGRRTSACYSSYVPAIRDEHLALSKDLVTPRSIDRLRGLGFTTLIVHHEILGGRELTSRLREEAELEAWGLKPIRIESHFSAWAITKEQE